MALRRFIVERDIPGVGGFDEKTLSGAAAKSNNALCDIGAKDIQWVESFVADDKTFCVYLAANEEAIRRHSVLSGFPANRITEVRALIDPTTEKQAFAGSRSGPGTHQDEAKFDSSGRLVLESKDHIRERLGLPPDLGDAAALTFALDFNELAEDFSEYRWRPWHEAGSDAWMAA